jgi:8-oxo-dGTP pyrophosphatase MutT (NUDIX family)
MVPLLEQLIRYQPADETERRHHLEMIELVRTSRAPFARSSFGPGHITASLFIVDGAGRLLLHHHRRLGRWLQMGGHLEPGETPLEAALREGAEESGLRDLEATPQIFDLDVHPIPAGKGEPDHHHYDVRYLARTRSPGSVTIDAAESIDLRWVTLSDAVTLMAAAESRRVIDKIIAAL